MDKTALVSVAHLREFIESLLDAGGFASHESKAMANSLILSELTGHGSHGLIRVGQYLDLLKKGHLISGAKLKIIQETPTNLTADAQAGIGQVVMPKLLEDMYVKLKSTAVVSAAVCNCGLVGRLGEWVEYAAQAGYVALLMVNDNGTCFYVAPPGGKKAVTSTNPIAFAVPLSDGNVFSADMSTSAIAFGKVKLARLTGIEVPPHCLQDANGNPTTDPEAFFGNPSGSLLPMGGEQGYKGFALAMFVEMLAAGLSGGQATPATAGTKYAKTPMLNNLTLTLWNPEFFAGAEHLKHEAAKLIDTVRASPPIDPAKPIRLAGDRRNATRQNAESRGLKLDDNLILDLANLGKELGVASPFGLNG